MRLKQYKVIFGLFFLIIILLTLQSYTFSRGSYHQHLKVQNNLKSIIGGAWKSIDLRPFNDLNEGLNAHVTEVTEGHSAQLVLERQVYVYVAKLPFVKTICEIGFNGGHSAGLWLLANPLANVIMFDIWTHPYAEPAEDFLRSPLAEKYGIIDGNNRLKIIKGSSHKTLKSYATEHPHSCDIISVDGDHTLKGAIEDLEDVLPLVRNENALILIDDTNCKSYWCKPVDRAVEIVGLKGQYKKVFGISELEDTRGLSVLQPLLEQSFDPSLLPCLNTLKLNMPLNADGIMRAHHYDSGQFDKWNVEQRLIKMKLVSPCKIWYVGGNTHADDGLELLKDYSCSIEIFEPIPEYVKELKKNWHDLARTSDYSIHSFGLGASNRRVDGVQLKDQSTFAMTGTEKQGASIEIRSVLDTWHSLGSPKIDLLYVNCEGCEWEMWEAFIETNIIKQVGILNIGTHWFKDINNINQRYCTIEKNMYKTHDMEFKQAWGWERWILRK
jgi:hypothetical protein